MEAKYKSSVTAIRQSMAFSSLLPGFQNMRLPYIWSMDNKGFTTIRMITITADLYTVLLIFANHKVILVLSKLKRYALLTHLLPRPPIHSSVQMPHLEELYPNSLWTSEIRNLKPQAKRAVFKENMISSWQTGSWWQESYPYKIY